MDEILCANYMLFDDVVRETSYDLWVGDESWEVDHFLHENPERKIAPYAFLTDVVGFLPVDPEGDPREVELCADYNAEMIEHRERFPHVRDRSVFIGGFDELPDASLGAGLPGGARLDRAVVHQRPVRRPVRPGAPTAGRSRLRRELGYGTGYPLYVAAVGGTAVGPGPARADRRGVRAGAQGGAGRTDGDGDRPAARPRAAPGRRGHGQGRATSTPLFEHLACADVAVVQGGLSTTMELVAARRPFVYFPLAHHWEQQHFVAHRLDHYGAGVRMDYASTTPPRPGRRDDGGAARSGRRTARCAGAAPTRPRRCSLT